MFTISNSTPMVMAANRILAILLVVMVWLVSHLVKQTRANQTDLNLMAELASSQEDPVQAFIHEAQKEEAAELQYKFESALKLLKETQSKEKFNQRYLYELPWYVIIGAPGSGKTTLLTHSGIHFPAKEKFGQTSVQGVGGTRNCSWLFSDEAIFIDTAGRYTTQDSHKALDESAWVNFLGLLKKYRPAKPVNGVLLTLSLSDMLTFSEEELRQYARTSRQRIMELHEQLGIAAPIYLLLTKCDLIAGFNEFFEDLDLEKRGQVWGFTFPADPETPLNTATIYFERLLARLQKRKFNRIQEERDLIRRGLILDFPQQMELIQPLVTLFLEEAFRPSRYEEQLLLRGVYFTSGTQQGTPIDRVARRLAQAFGLDIQKLPVFSGHVKSFFIKKLLSEVLFPESELAGVDPKVIRRRNLRFWALNASLLIFASLMIALWATSYTRNKIALTQIDALMHRYETLQLEAPQHWNDPKHLLDRLNITASASQVFQEQPWWEGFGLYQGKKIAWSVQRIYQKLLVHDLLTLIKSRLEGHLDRYLKTDIPADQSKLYELLKVYLMLGMPEKMEPYILHGWAQMDIRRLFERDSLLQGQLQTHLDHLFRLPLDAMPLNQNLIAQARAQLNANPLHLNLYAYLKSRFILDVSHDFHIRDVLNPNALSLMTTGNGQPAAELTIPGWYTLEGYQTVFEDKGIEIVHEALKQSWVLIPPGETSRKDIKLLYRELQELYFGDYERYWNNLLNNLRIKSAGNIDQAIHITDTLSGPETPLKPLLLALLKHTAFISQVAKNQKIGSDSGKVWYGIANAQAADSDMAPSRLLKELSNGFKDLTDLVQPSGKQPPALDEVFLQLAKLRDAMLQPANVRDTKIIEQSREQFARLPEPIKSWLLPLTLAGLN